MEWQNYPGSTPKKCRFKSYQTLVQREPRRMHDKWWEKKAEEIQGFAYSNNSKQFFNSLKTVFGPLKSGSSPLLSADGTILIKDKAAIREKWKERFSQLLNRPPSVDPIVLDQIPKRAVIEDLDDPSCLDEVRKVIKKMGNGTAPGKDGISAKIFKALSNEAL